VGTAEPITARSESHKSGNLSRLKMVASVERLAQFFVVICCGSEAGGPGAICSIFTDHILSGCCTSSVEKHSLPDMRAPPLITRSTSARLAVLVSPGVVIARAPCAYTAFHGPLTSLPASNP